MNSVERKARRIAIVGVCLATMPVACHRGEEWTFASSPPDGPCDADQALMLARTPPTVPTLDAAPARDRATIVGTISDSGSGRGLRGSTIRLTPLNGSAANAIVAHSDSTGAFVVSELTPGGYRRELLSTNFPRAIDAVSVVAGVDTMAIVRKGGLPICMRELNEVLVKRPR